MIRIVTIILIMSSISLISQEFSVRGRIQEYHTKKTISGASISLKHLRNEKVIGAISKKNGTFLISNTRRGRYQLTITFVGYEKYESKIVVKNQDVDLGNIYLRESSSELDEVKVYGKTPAVELKGDTTQFNADAYKANPDANAEDLVQKMPGFMMQNGRLQTQGEDIKKVLMDGKPFFGEDPSAALKNLPAEVIDKVQVYDEQSEQSQFTGFDDGNTTKTLNIITRVNMKSGQFGKAYAGYGTDDRYQAGTNFNLFGEVRRVSILAQSNNVNQQNFAIDDILGAVSSFSPRRFSGMRMMRGMGRSPRGGRGGRGGSSVRDFLVEQQDGISLTNAFGTNYTDEWGESIKISGSYFINQNNNDAESNLFREYIDQEQLNQVYREEQNSNNNNLNHRFNLRFNWDINESNSLLIRPRITFQTNDGDENTLASTDLNSQILNRTDNGFSSELTGYTIRNQILWRHKFKTKGRTFSASINNSNNSNSGENLLAAESFYFDNFIDSDTINQKSILDMKGDNITYRLSYTEPLIENTLLEFNYSGGYNQDISDKETFNYDESQSGFTLKDTALSNQFTNDYYSQSIGANFQYRKDAFNLSFGVADQWSKLDNDQIYPYNSNIQKEYNNVLPNMRLQYKFSRRNHFRIRYRTSTDIPSASQLQEVVNNSNPLQLSTGNLNLDEAYSHSLFMNYMSVDIKNSSNFFIMAGGRYSDNYIGENTIITKSDTVLSSGYLVPSGTQLSYPENMSGYMNFRTFLNYGFPVDFLSSNLNFNTGYTFNKIPGMFNNVVNNSNNNTITFGVVLSSNISPEIDFSLMSYTNMNYVSYSLDELSNTEYISQNTRIKVNLFLFDALVVNSNLSHQYYSGLSSEYNTNYFIWNAYIGYKVFDNQGEFRLSGMDLLGQNQSIFRNVSDIYVEDVETNVLQQYLMLSFIYTFRNYGTGENNF